MKGYTFDQLKAAYQTLGVKKGATVIVKTDLRLLGPYDSATTGLDILEAHYKALHDLIDFDHGTLVTTTATTSLCNTDTPFDLNTTPSQMGALTEYIRNKPFAVRSFHPFLSYTAIGKDAHKICDDVSRHGFGPETPKDRLLGMSPLFVSIGQHARLTSSVVHHAEMQMGVPYRYVREYIHPVVRNGAIALEAFYMHVWYRACQNRHDGVQKIFNEYQMTSNPFGKVPVGRGFVYAMPLVPFYESTVQALKKDIYAFLVEPPQEKPYRL